MSITSKIAALGTIAANLERIGRMDRPEPRMVAQIASEAAFKIVEILDAMDKGCGCKKPDKSG